MNEKILLLARKIAEAGKNIVFTGAGISTESGISDYRSKGGIWDKFRPVYFQEFMTSREARVEYWRRKAELYPDLTRAKPNPAHMALFHLYKMGLIEAVITQNIDGLHQASGLPEDSVIELHGNTLRVRCMQCESTTSVHEVQKRIEEGDLAPECECGGYLKSDTVSFGQTMPESETEKATHLSRNCDFFLVVGSTLLVHPAALMPEYARQNGAFLGIVNLSETPYDKICDARIKEKAGEVLPAVENQVRRLYEG